MQTAVIPRGNQPASLGKEGSRRRSGLSALSVPDAGMPGRTHRLGPAGPAAATRGPPATLRGTAGPHAGSARRLPPARGQPAVPAASSGPGSGGPVPRGYGRGRGLCCPGSAAAPLTPGAPARGDFVPRPAELPAPVPQPPQGGEQSACPPRTRPARCPSLGGCTPTRRTAPAPRLRSSPAEGGRAEGCVVAQP